MMWSRVTVQLLICVLLAQNLFPILPPAPATVSQTLMTSSAPTQWVAPVRAVPAKPAAPLGYELFVEELFGGCNPSRNQTNIHCGDPINTATGNYWESIPGLSVPGRGPALNLFFTYHSLMTDHTNQLGPMGYGWSHSYYMSNVSMNYQGMQCIFQENGSCAHFNSSNQPVGALALLGYDAISLTKVMTRTQTQDQFSFQQVNGTWRLTKIVDRNGYATTLTYSPTTYVLSSVTDTSGRSLNFSYTLTGTNRFLTQVSDPSSRTMSFGYDSTGDLRNLTDVDGKVTSFVYDGNHHILTTTRPNGGVVTTTYDAYGSAIRQTDPLNHLIRLQYEDCPPSTCNVVTTTVTNTLNSVDYVTKYEYGKYEHNLTKVIQNPGTPQQAVWQYHFYGMFLEEMIDPLNHHWYQTWDITNGTLLTHTDPLNRTTRYTYNSLNEPLAITNALSIPITFTYDISGNLSTMAQPLTQTNQVLTTTLGYDPAHPGDVLTLTNPLGKQWHYAYNTYGYAISSTNPLTKTTGYSYDTIGRLLQITTPRNYTATFAYTPYGAPTIITDTLGHVTRYAYDGNHNPTVITDTRGPTTIYTTTYTYDLADQLTRVTRPDSTHSDYGYDGNGHLITQTNGLGQSTLYQYDSFERLISVRDPLTRTAAYDYDLAGRPLVITNAQGLTTTLGYDDANQLRSVTYGDGGTTPPVQYAYNAIGARTVLTDGTGTSRYTYDSLGRLTSAQNGNNKTIRYGYDLGSRLTALGYPDPSSSGVLTATRGYDAANQLTSVTDWLTNNSIFGYNDDGALTSLTYPNGVVGTVGRDAADAVSSVGYIKNVTTLFAETYARDPAGLLTTASDSTATHNYEYDKLDRLTGDGLSVGQPVSRTWTYDGAYQITQTSVQNGITTNGTRTYNAGNQLLGLKEIQGLTTTKDWSFAYSLNGNRTQFTDKLLSKTTNYGYDQANRLTSSGLAGGINNPTYAYNGDGLRTSKGVGLAVTQYTWDVGAGLPLLLQEGGTSYLYGPGGMILEQVPSGSSTPYYYHPDQLGSVRALSDSSGATAATYRYDAYGTLTTSTGSVTNPFRYTGAYQDSETGFYYLRARYYDPATQQFLSRDPLVARTEQAYGYVAGSPLNRTDPSGLLVGCACFNMGASLILGFSYSTCICGDGTHLKVTQGTNITIGLQAGIGPGFSLQGSTNATVDSITGDAGGMGVALGAGSCEISRDNGGNMSLSLSLGVSRGADAGIYGFGGSSSSQPGPQSGPCPTCVIPGPDPNGHHPGGEGNPNDNGSTSWDYWPVPYTPTPGP